MNTFLKDLLDKVVPILLTAAGFLGFVTVVGGVTVWFHFYTAELPAVQAIDAMPRSQLLVNGAVPLILFGVLGVVAVAACYAIDRGGRAREGMAHSLMFLFGAATIFVILAAPTETRHELGLTIAIVGGLVVSAVLVRRGKVPDEDTVRLEKVRGEIEAPHRYQTTFGWVVRLAAVSLIVAWLAYRISDEWWIGVAILAAGALALMDFRIAEGTGNRFTIFAVAVFFSLPLYGAVVSLLILANEPLVQPAALIRGGGEGRTVVEGLYIADSDSHIYFGAVATDGCQSTNLRPGSGTIFAIPKSEVLDLRVGRGQTVADAIRNAPAITKLLVRNAGAFPDRRTPAEKKTVKPVTNQKPLWPLRYTRDSAIRQEPEVGKVVPAVQKPNGRVNVVGKGFGTETGRLLIGGRSAKVLTWDDELIKVIVPINAKSSRVRVECPSGDVMLGVS